MSFYLPVDMFFQRTVQGSIESMELTLIDAVNMMKKEQVERLEITMLTCDPEYGQGIYVCINGATTMPVMNREKFGIIRSSVLASSYNGVVA